MRAFTDAETPPTIGGGETVTVAEALAETLVPNVSTPTAVAVSVVVEVITTVLVNTLDWPTAKDCIEAITPYVLSVMFTSLNAVSPVLVTLNVYVTLLPLLTVVALETLVNLIAG